MKLKCSLLENMVSSEKRVTLLSIIFGLFLMVLMVAPALAVDIQLGDKQIRVMGYINQGVGFGIAGDEHDTKEGFQQAVFQILLESQYRVNNDLRFFGSVGWNSDWAYPILEDNSEWKKKRFDESDDRLFSFDESQDILKELHVTWSPDSWLLRFGKQIVSWGEMDGFRLMDQINPLDQRRGMIDVEFETTIIPIWLARVEYNIQPNSSWLQDFGVEFVFNPNFDFRGDEAIMLGNDAGGIWTPGIEMLTGGPFPMDKIYLGSADTVLDSPDSFMDEDGFEYGVRLKAVIWDYIVTLNAFYGRNNTPVSTMSAVPPGMEISKYDGRMILHPAMEGFYPRQRFVGMTFTGDLEKLYLSALGGVAPVLRIEAFYAFNNTFVTNLGAFDENDEIRWAVGIDWKVWLRFLNPRAAFMISAQFYHSKILDYPSAGYQNIEDDSYQASLMLNTSFYHNKIQPMLFWLRDINSRSNSYNMRVVYEQSHVWNYTLGAILFNGDKTGEGFDVFANKDQIYFTLGYRF